MKIVLILMAAAAITGCAQQAQQGPTLSQIQHECGAGLKPFEESWPCVRVGFSEVAVSPDLKATYIARGDVIAERVRSGQMTDAEAKLAMAQARQDAYETEMTRSAAQRAERQQNAAAYSQLFSSMNQNRPQPAPFTVPSPTTTNCQWIGSVWTCQRY